MDTSAPPTFVIILFPFFFAAMWCVIILLLSMIGGWHRLAEHFQTDEQPLGRRFLMQSGRVGVTAYSGCLTVYSSAAGIYLSVWLPFRLGHPPLFIPWNAVNNASTRRFLWIERIVFDVGSPSLATLQLSKKVFDGQYEVD